MTKQEVIIKKLFNVTLNGKNMLANQSTIDFYKEWRKDASLEIKEEIEEVDIKGIDIFITNSSKRNCYLSVDYKVVSDKPLDDFMLEVLRASGNFNKGAGQEVGKLYSKTEDEGKFIYNLKSVCDSSD